MAQGTPLKGHGCKIVSHILLYSYVCRGFLSRCMITMTFFFQSTYQISLDAIDPIRNILR